VPAPAPVVVPAAPAPAAPTVSAPAPKAPSWTTHFADGSTEISVAEQQALEVTLSALKPALLADPGAQVVVSGDIRKAEPLVLATRRAELVRAYLVANDLPAKRVKAIRAAASRNDHIVTILLVPGAAP